MPYCGRRFLRCSTALAILACAAPEPSQGADSARRPDTGSAPGVADSAQYSSPIVLFVSPDSLEIEQMKAKGGDDFYVIADDAMFYRSHAYELADSLHIPHAEVRRSDASFLVGGRAERVSWRDANFTWFVVVYDGRTRPRIAADIDIRQALFPGDSSPTTQP